MQVSGFHFMQTELNHILCIQIVFEQIQNSNFLFFDASFVNEICTDAFSGSKRGCASKDNVEEMTIAV